MVARALQRRSRRPASSLPATPISNSVLHTNCIGISRPSPVAHDLHKPAYLRFAGLDNCVAAPLVCVMIPIQTTTVFRYESRHGLHTTPSIGVSRFLVECWFVTRASRVALCQVLRRWTISLCAVCGTF